MFTYIGSGNGAYAFAEGGREEKITMEVQIGEEVFKFQN